MREADTAPVADPGIVLRLAAPADLALLRSWDTRPHVMAATGPDADFAWEAELSRTVPWREFLIAELAGRPVGVMQIIDPAEEETHYWGEAAANLRAIDIWIGEERDLGRGLGTQMLRLALARCFADPRVAAVLVDPLAANERAIRFYKRVGFRPIGRRMFGADDCLVLEIARAQWEKSAPKVRA